MSPGPSAIAEIRFSSNPPQAKQSLDQIDPHHLPFSMFSAKLTKLSNKLSPLLGSIKCLFLKQFKSLRNLLLRNQNFQ